jgi:hypothetical protein
MLYREITDVSCKNYTEDINTERGQNSHSLELKLAVRMINIKAQTLKDPYSDTKNSVHVEDYVMHSNRIQKLTVGRNPLFRKFPLKCLTWRLQWIQIRVKNITAKSDGSSWCLQFPEKSQKTVKIEDLFNYAVCVTKLLLHHAETRKFFLSSIWLLWN